MATSYCDHSRGPHTSHFGHHEGHHHEADGDVVDNLQNLPDDGEAAHCHGLSAVILSAGTSACVFAEMLQARHGALVDWRSLPLEPPERPAWVDHA